MPYAQAPLSRETLYRREIPVAIVDPAERARFAQQPLAFEGVNEAVMPADPAAKQAFLDELGAFLRTGHPGRFLVVEENLRDLYLVAIGGLHRISRKIYAKHPLLPDKLLVIGGMGVVRPAADGQALTLQTPSQDVTLHELFPDLPETSMSAACPTSRKTIESVPNEDPVGSYSIAVAQAKFRHVATIAGGRGGIDPGQFPVVTNVAWGIIGDASAFYVYAVPDSAVPVCELLRATNQQEIAPALERYTEAGKQLMRALRHLHEAGYVFNQPHQGNVYHFVDSEGQTRILIADLDTLQSIQGYRRTVPPGQYLSPMAFATLVNVQVASTHMAHIGWIDFFWGVRRELGIERFRGADALYASIVAEPLDGYLGLGPARKADIHAAVRGYYHGLSAKRAGDQGGTEGPARLLQGDLFEMDVFGFWLTYALMDEAYRAAFGARGPLDGIDPAELRRIVARSATKRHGTLTPRQMTDLMNHVTNQIIEERSNEALQEFLTALSKRKRVSARGR